MCFRDSVACGRTELFSRSVAYGWVFVLLLSLSRGSQSGKFQGWYEISSLQKPVLEAWSLRTGIYCGGLGFCVPCGEGDGCVCFGREVRVGCVLGVGRSRLGVCWGGGQWLKVLGERVRVCLRRIRSRVEGYQCVCVLQGEVT